MSMSGSHVIQVGNTLVRRETTATALSMTAHGRPATTSSVCRRRRATRVTDPSATFVIAGTGGLLTTLVTTATQRHRVAGQGRAELSGPCLRRLGRIVLGRGSCYQPGCADALRAGRRVAGDGDGRGSRSRIEGCASFVDGWLVGREDDLAAGYRLLSEPDVRLLTVTGT